MPAHAEAADRPPPPRLQPNPHVAGSKPWSSAERALDFDASPYADTARRGHALLQEAGEALRAEGVRFHDLTMVFVDVSDPIYVDSCCHVNAEGSALLAEAMASAIDEDLEGASASDD